MTKINPKNIMSGMSLDIEQTNKEKLKAIFPECFSEGILDIDKLLSLCGEFISNDFEKYKFEWKGKSECLRLAQKRSTGTLRPVKNESVNFDNTQNVYIKGDNLEVLKLLQTSYYRKIKMIYIDPPYNTGNDFVYEDDFADPISKYKEVTQQTTKSNPETMGRFHTNWLNMMYPRLRLAANLLTDDGVIFISIDDNEAFNLKKMCDEVFGEENFVNMICCNMKNTAGASGGGEDKRLKKNCEFILIYAKNYETMPIFKGSYLYTELSELIQKYIDDGISWKYTSVLIDEGEKSYIGSTVDGDGNEIKVYLRKNPVIKSVKQIAKEENITEKEAYKKYGVKIFQTTNAQSSIRTRIINYRAENNIQEDLISIEYIPKTGKNKGVVYEQFYKGDKCRLFVWLRDTSEEINGELYKKDLQGTYWDFNGAMKNLTKEGGVLFANGKKPVDLIKRMVNMQTENNDIILDFFSGSATTAHAVMKLNAEDGGNRRFICVQLPELCDEKSEAYKAGYKTICDIGIERIKRAGKKILSENENTNSLDIGFKVFELDTSNLKTWDSTLTLDDYAQEEILNRMENILSRVKTDRTSLDMVYEIMLKIGKPLTDTVKAIELDGKTAYTVGENSSLIICLAKDITPAYLEKLCELKPSKLVIGKDDLYTDSAMANALYICQDRNIELKLI